MTQAVLQIQKSDRSAGLIGSEAKNPLSINSNRNWEDIAGLSWILLEESHKYNLDS